MTKTSLTERFWRSLTNASVRRGPRPAPRGRMGYNFWQRYWASLTATNLPLPSEEESPNSTVVTPPTRRPATVQPSSGGWFRLPSLPRPAALLAAGGDQVISEATANDGAVTLFVRAPAGVQDSYRLEVVLRDVDAAPAVMSVRYTSMLLLIPLVRPRFGPISAHVLLPRFAAETPWEISAPQPPTRTEAWTTDVVTASVGATLNRATRDAWRQIGGLVDDELASVINQALA